MKAVMVLAIALMTGLSAFAYEYDYKENVSYNGYRCWVIKAWNVSSADLREYASQVNSSLASSCADAMGKKCTPMNSGISCKSSENCSRTFRSCAKG